MQRWYTLIYCIIYPFFNLFHPSRGIGKEHLPEGGALLCPNHTKASDPFFVVFSLGLKRRLTAMAKMELIRVPVIGWLLSKAGVVGVDRGKADMNALKTAMKMLKNGEKMLLFPEGTRVEEDAEVHEAKSGAAMLAVRTGVPIIPVYIPGKKKWFRPTTVVFGEPFYPKTAERRATAEEYKAINEELMTRILALAEQVKK